LTTTLEKFVDYGVNVWGIDSCLDRYEIANRSIEMTKSFFGLLGLPATLTEVGIDAELFEIMAQKASEGLFDSFYPLTSEDVYAIFRTSL